MSKKTIQATWDRLFGKKKAVKNKEVNARQTVPVDANGEPIERFEHNRNVPSLGLPSTFQNKDEQEFSNADDGASVPKLGLPQTFNGNDEKSAPKHHNIVDSQDYSGQADSPSDGDTSNVPTLGLPVTYPEEK